MVDILGWPEQVATALDTKRASGAEVAVVKVHPLPDGRVLVGAVITEPPSAFPPPSPSAAQAVHRTRWWVRLWGCVAPEPLEDILHPGERCRMWTRRHWFLPARSVIRGLAGLPAAMVVYYLLRVVADEFWWLQVILWFGPLLNAAQMGYRVLLWLADRIIVTDQRLILAAGVVHRTAQGIPLSRIRGIRVNRSLAGRVFGYGCFKIGYPDFDLEEGAVGLPGGTIHFVPDPKRVYHATGLAKLS